MFFDRQKKATINRFFCTTNDVLEMTIASKIVDELIGDLYFHPNDDAANGDDQPISKANVMRLFQLDEGGATYSVTIKNPLRFWLAINHTSSGLSFQQTATIIEQHRVRTKNLKLMGLNDHMVSQFVRTHPSCCRCADDFRDLVPTTCLCIFHVSDGSTQYESSYFNIRIRVGVNGVLHNLDLMIVSFYGRHTAVNILALIVKILDVLFLMWRNKLISVSNNGKNTMIGRHGGLVTLLEKEATNNIMCVWCAPHQMDIVIKKVMKAMMDGLFYKIAHVFSIHLRAQLNLIMEMDGAKCPKDTTRWVAFGKVIKWFLHHRC
jgi:hypothetical protein